jgi:hypothetical protein
MAYRPSGASRDRATAIVRARDGTNLPRKTLPMRPISSVY